MIASLRSAFSQAVAVSVKNIILLGFGMSLGFPTILIPALRTGDWVLNDEELSWLGKNPRLSFYDSIKY